MAVLKNGSKCSHTTCMLRFFTVFRLALIPNLYFEMGYSNLFCKGRLVSRHKTEFSNDR